MRVDVFMEGSSTSRAHLERKHASELQEQHFERVRPIHVLKSFPESSTLLLSRSSAFVRLAAASPVRLGKDSEWALRHLSARARVSRSDYRVQNRNSIQIFRFCRGRSPRPEH